MKEKICNFECTEGDLWSFLKDAEAGLVPKDFSLYSIDTILKCVDLYKEGKIASSYVELWARAYSYFFEPVIDTEVFSKEKFLLLEIARYLKDMTRRPADTAGDTFLLLDSIYKNPSLWDISYSVVQKRYPDEEIVNDVEAVLVNRINMEYIILYKSYRGEVELNLEGNWLSLSELSFYEIELDNQGFKRLKIF